MAFDAFLKITEIEGESREKLAPGAIDVLSYSFGVQHARPAGAGGGGTAGRPEFTDLSVVVPQSSATVPLMLAAATGKVHQQASLTLVRSAGDQQQAYYEMLLHDVAVTSVHEAGTVGDDRPTNAVTLAFIKWTVTYWPQDSEGSPDKVIKGGYDRKEERPF